MLLELRQLEAFVREVVEAPRRLDGELRHSAERQSERNRKSGAEIAFAVAAGDAVDGQHHDVDAGLLRPLHHRAVEAPVLVEIELVDLRRVGGLPQLLQADRAERRDAEHRAEFRRRRRDGALPFMMKQTLQRGWRAVEGRGELLPQDGDAEIDGLDAAKDVGHEVAAFEARGVAAVGRLVVGGPVDVVENGARQPRLGETPEIVEVVAGCEAHAPQSTLEQAELRARLARFRRRLAKQVRAKRR